MKTKSNCGNTLSETEELSQIDNRNILFPEKSSSKSKHRHLNLNDLLKENFAMKIERFSDINTNLGTDSNEI